MHVRRHNKVCYIIVYIFSNSKPLIFFVQILNHGTTIIQWDEDGGRSSLCVLRLEADNATLTWCRPGWSALRGVTSPPDFALHADQSHAALRILYARYSSGSEDNYSSLEEGYLDVLHIKEVYLGDESVDISAITKRHGLELSDSEHRCITVVHGSSMSVNHKLWFIGPKGVTMAWYRGLCKLRVAAVKLKNQMDKRVQWLKQQYLQLYYEGEKCQGPTPAEAVKVRFKTLYCRCCQRKYYGYCILPFLVLQGGVFKSKYSVNSDHLDGDSVSFSFAALQD